MSFIEFSSLAPHAHALTDASSLHDLAVHAPALTCSLTPESARHILADLDGLGLRPSLNLLERWIVVDSLVADVVALDTVTGGHVVRSFSRSYDRRIDVRMSRQRRDSNFAEHKQTAFVNYVKSQLLDHNADPSTGRDLARIQELSRELSISYTTIPSAIFQRCMALVRKTSRAIKDAQPQTRWTDFGFGTEKTYGEILDELYDDAGFLARSHFNVERTLVYFETAAIVGIPLVLHPNRFLEIDAINSGCTSAYDSVKNTLRKAFEEPVRSQLADIGVSYEIELPPLASRLVDVAGKNRISIVEAAKQIKQSRPAVEFRSWLSQIQVNLSSNTNAGKINALRMLQNVNHVAKGWVAETDNKVGVTYKRRELRLSMIPRVGGLLELLGSKSVNDPILNRKGYLTFISWWFDHEI